MSTETIRLIRDGETRGTSFAPVFFEIDAA